MNKVAMFCFVSEKQFIEDCKKCDIEESEEKLREYYRNIILPKRATSGSAGYDFYAPFDFIVPRGCAKTFPTGVRCQIDDGWVLTCYPRSGQGFKYGITLANTVGVIDSDYYFADNEGHIHVKLINDSSILAPEKFIVKQGQAYMQGIFLPYGITYTDNAEDKRTGGFGSTDKV